jgi:hypothetical protein
LFNISTVLNRISKTIFVNFRKLKLQKSIETISELSAYLDLEFQKIKSVGKVETFDFLKLSQIYQAD